MRNISFALTTNQFRMREKTVTRRLGWKNLKPGDRLMACVKCMGLKPGEKLERLGEIEVVSVKREALAAIYLDRDYLSNDAAREGFPDLTAYQFADMFCEHMKVDHKTFVTRIEFKYVEEVGLR